MSGLTIDMFGNCFYRDYAFKADDNILIFDCAKIPDKAKIFIVTAINKATNNIYSYTNQYRIKSFNNTTVLLPINALGEIDYIYMEKYIRAIEKLIIEDVIKYKDDAIDRMKELLNRD